MVLGSHGCVSILQPIELTSRVRFAGAACAVRAAGAPAGHECRNRLFTGTMAAVDRDTLLQTGLATSSSLGHSPPRGWLCRVVSGPSSGETVTLGARCIVVGADPTCEFRIEDPTVSRRHAELEALPDGVRVRDLGSKNGTRFQASRITEVVVPAGASVEFGRSTAQFWAAPRRFMPPSNRQRFGGLVGQSSAIREVFAVLELASPTDVPVIVEGETGTGKELVARAIHDHSQHADKPFVVADCTVPNEQLIESHLFGHVRGAFTGAVAARKGAFVLAEGGTLFFDEIGDLPLGAQAKLLRALEQKTVTPVGSDRSVHVSLRVVAATHRNLQQMAEAGTFRFDLLQRLSVIHVHIPPLRERLDDIPALVQFFYEGRGVDPGPIDGENLAELRGYAWPGNVRELRNVLDRAWVLSSGGVAFRDLCLSLQPSGARVSALAVDTALTFKEAKQNCVTAFEREYIAELFAQNQYNVTRTAQRAGLAPRHLRRLLQRYGFK